MRIAFAASMLLAIASCERVFALPEIPPAIDAPNALDAVVDGRICYGTGLLSVCIDPSVPATLALRGMINTTDDPRCVVIPQTNSLELCVLAATTITVPEATRVIGDRPLVLVALDHVEISSLLDVSSKQFSRGAGGQPGDCVKPANGANTTGNGAGGGPGGSFGFVGGPGASGNSSGTLAAGGTAAPAVTFLSAVRGGCLGGNGGIVGAVTAASAGSAGGAVYVIAVGAINVTSIGAINASGAGGQGGPLQSGGAGGGAGGLIGLDAATVTINGRVFARGGGGGGGGGTAVAGARGQEAIDAISPVAGGNPGLNGSGGGDGCGSGVGGIPGNPAVNGGGGGGGGCGFLRIYGARVIAMNSVSPMPTP